MADVKDVPFPIWGDSTGTGATDIPALAGTTVLMPNWQSIPVAEKTYRCKACTGSSEADSRQLRFGLAVPGATALRQGLEALSAQRPLLALWALLRAERLAACYGDEAAAAAARRAAAGVEMPVPPAARRNGSLLLRAPAAAGARVSPERAYEEASEPKTDAAWRFEGFLVGGEVPRVDCGTEAGFQKALGYVRRRLPVIFLNLNLMPSTNKWDMNYLRRHTNEWPGMNVLRSAGGENRYLYYVPEQSDRDMAAFASAPRHASSDMRLSFEGFLDTAKQDPSGRYYLQAPLVLRQPTDAGLTETWSPGIDAELRKDCEQRVNRERLEALQAAGGFGFWSRSQLFVGPSESLSPAHYDQYDNIYMQVEGEKHFLLFDPRAAEGLYAFPVSHPYDEYAMVDLQNVDSKSFPRARRALEKRGAVATLRPGEALFIPTHWWHHVQGTASRGAWSISVNFWFAIHRVLMEGPHPFPQHLELELARHVELLLSDVGGSASVGALARDLQKDAENAELSELDETFFAVRLFLLDRLSALLGAGNVAKFLSEHFPAERFQRSVVSKALRA
ncbi:HIF1AN [Symbiodinium sp. CCMP2592]|nr:HIF1AN [Symbiodinium sp. CCMP2592]